MKISHRFPPTEDAKSVLHFLHTVSALVSVELSQRRLLTAEPIPVHIFCHEFYLNAHNNIPANDWRP